MDFYTLQLGIGQEKHRTTMEKINLKIVLKVEQ